MIAIVRIIGTPIMLYDYHFRRGTFDSKGIFEVEEQKYLVGAHDLLALLFKMTTG